MRHYPTDLLLAVEHAERHPVEALAEHGLTGLLNGTALTEALDELFDGLGRYPWRPLPDGDVEEFAPVGTVPLDDEEPRATLRGLLYGLATGNRVVVRTGRRDLWLAVTGLLTGAGVPLPDVTVTDRDDRTAGPPFEVPPPRVRGDFPTEAARQAAELAADARAGWVGRLFTRDHLAGVSLAVARGRDVAEEPGRIGAKLRYLAGRARRTRYYRDLPAVTGRQDLTRLPILDKAVLDAHTPPVSRDMSSDAPPSGEILRSGATTGEPRYIVYSLTDWSNMVREAVPMLYGVGLEKGDRLVNALFGGSLYGGLITSSCELSRMPIECYTTGQHITVDDLLALVRNFSVNAVVGQPALILPLLREAATRDPGLRLEKVVYGGTAMTETDKAWLRERLGVRVISSILAANDGAQLGYQCPGLDGTLHHLCDDYNLIEVVDEEGRPVPDGEPGHLLVTALQKFEGPLIRYRIGDVGRVLPGRDCGCGIPGRILEYLGRSDGLIKVKARTVLYDEILTALAVFQVSRLQVEITSSDGTDTVVVRTESPLDLDPEKVRHLLGSEFEALSDRHAFGDGLEVFRLLVECHPEGGLPRNPVSGKVRPVIDRRVGSGATS
ncbi:phenylacetate--CoA ligase family protein [Streptosporangium sp. NPDC001559]|uniref:phenylacetate--CoA ligase family protein n=1 Tax=Streptosporangium sp. NPDC001559 TaxID=3366187 RepID=UPI0036EEFC24